MTSDSKQLVTVDLDEALREPGVSLVIEPDERYPTQPTTQQAHAFIERVASGESAKRVAEDVGSLYTRFMALANRNQLFAALYEAAKERRQEALRETSIEQSTYGVEKPVYYQGVLVGYERVFPANPQLQMHLKAAFPDEFRERSEVLTGDANNPPPRVRNDEDRAKLRRMIADSRDDEDDGSDLL